MSERDLYLSRRRFLAMSAGGITLAAITAACGDDDDDETAAATQTGGGSTTPAAGGAAKGTVLVGDVIDHALSDERWTGEFGWVTFKLHTAFVGGERAYFIRTDASDQAFAATEKLVHVPLMAKAIDADRGYGDIYLFDNGGAEQLPVMSTAPHLADYTPAFRIHRVLFKGSPATLESAEGVESARDAGTVEIEATDIIVNYPVVKWPGGELPVDSEKTAYLGGGQLIEPVNVQAETVTFKLHACFPSSRYIVTDVTMPPMATGMNIAAAPGAEALTAAGATAKILVFGNGLEGSGPMGAQKSVMDSTAGDAKWSPFWDHYTFVWKDGATAKLLKSEAEVIAAEQTQDLTRFPGTPDTNGTLFMVNCPVPVLAPIA